MSQAISIVNGEVLSAVLRKYDESLVQKYRSFYTDQKVLGKHYANSHELVKKYCRKYGLTNYINRPTDFYPEKIRLNKKIAEHFYLQSREIA